MRYSAILLALCTAVSAMAQTSPQQFTYTYRSATSANLVSVNIGGTVTFPSTRVGTSSSITFFVTSRADAAWTLSDVSTVGAGFSAAFNRTPLPANGTAAFQVTLTPRTEDTPTGALTVLLSGPAGATQVASFFLTSSSASTPSNSDITTSYVLASGNQQAVAAGGSVKFAPVVIGSRGTTVFVITNRGTSAVNVNSIGIIGDIFESTGLALLPATLNGGQEMRFTIAFAPQQRTDYAAILQVNIDGTTRSFTLEGSGVSPQLSYELITSSSTATIQPEDTISFPATTILTGKSSVSLRITNKGNAESRISSITTTGDPFLISTAPSLPATIAPNQTLTFTVQFAPRDVGDVSGKLRVDGTQFSLTGSGLGAKLSVTIISGVSRTTLGPNGTAVLPNTAVGDRLNFIVDVKNVGNQPSTLASLGVTGTGFSTPAQVPLPVRIDPGESMQVGVQFSPTILGSAFGTLQVEDQVFSIRVIGSQPPPIPSVNIVLPDKLEALAQPSISIKLADPYPIDLNGRLTMSFTSDSFIEDPAIQFLTGTRSVDFRIPANSTQAVFGNTAQQTQFQTGSIAGVIRFNATFSVATVDVTPTSGVVHASTIASAEPQIRSVQQGTKSGNTFELVIAGYSTARSVTKLDFLFTAAPGTTLKTTKLSADVENAFNNWYQSAVSKIFGSQFTVTVKFDLAGNGNAVQAVTVTASNAKGTSVPKTVTIK